MFPDAPRTSSDLTSSKSPDVPHVDGIIGSVSQTSTKSSSKQNSISNTGSSHSNNPPNAGKTSKVNVVHSTTADKASKGKKKGKFKSKSNTPKQDPPKSSADDASKRNLKYPCLICEEDHYTKDCTQHVEVSHLLKWTPTILKEPFPSEQTHLVD